MRGVLLPIRAAVKCVFECQLLDRAVLCSATLVTHLETSGSSLFSFGTGLVMIPLLASSLLNMCPRSRTPALPQQTLQ